jgi:hypothetical protein
MKRLRFLPPSLSLGECFLLAYLCLIYYLHIRYQCIITALICYGFGILGEGARKGNGMAFFEGYPMVRYTFSSGISVLPLSIVFVGMITFNNVCLKYVEVSFYNGTVHNINHTFITDRRSISRSRTIPFHRVQRNLHLYHPWQNYFYQNMPYFACSHLRVLPWN